MEWTEHGIILGTRRHGETSVIVELFTREHGRHFGMVRGGRSRRIRPTLQAGNSVIATWRARLADHLGLFAIELQAPRAALWIDLPHALYAFATMAAHVRLLPERDPHPALYARFEEILPLLEDRLAGAAALVGFELMVLAELGFGLDLRQCAATGSEDDLVFVSPRSGRAVSRTAGEPYADRLLPLPGFLRSARSLPQESDISAAFRLCEWFLMRDVHGPRGLPLPPERARLLAAIAPAAPPER